MVARLLYCFQELVLETFQGIYTNIEEMQENTKDVTEILADTVSSASEANHDDHDHDDD